MHTVLILDRSKEDVAAIKELLRKHGYRIYVSYRPLEGLSKAKEKKPDLILLGIDLSNFNGLDLIKEIKLDIELAHTHIIVLFSETDDFNKVLAIELGADDYIIKPIYCTELLARMKSILKCNKRISSCKNEKQGFLALE